MNSAIITIYVVARATARSNLANWIRDCFDESTSSRNDMSLWNFSSQFLIYDLLEVGEWLCAYDGKSIHKKGRGGLHAKVKRKLHIFLNEGIMTSIRKTGGERIHIQVRSAAYWIYVASSNVSLLNNFS